MELRSISQSDKGKYLEEIASNLLSKNLNWELQNKNKKIHGVEVDLIFLDQDGTKHFVEVKSLMSEKFLETRVAKRQTLRIRNVLRIELEKSLRTRAHLAAVHPQTADCRIYLDYFTRDIV